MSNPFTDHSKRLISLTTTGRDLPLEIEIVQEGGSGSGVVITFKTGGAALVYVPLSEWERSALEAALRLMGPPRDPAPWMENR